jgi:hypothetical protein
MEEDLEDLEWRVWLSSKSLQILEARSISMANAARRDSSITFSLTPEEEENKNQSLIRLQRRSNAITQDFIEQKEEHRILVEHLKRIARKRTPEKQSGSSQYGGGTDTSVINAYIEFRHAFSRVQIAHVQAQNLINNQRRRDSGINEDMRASILESEREDIAAEIIEADAQLEIAEKNLNNIQNKHVTENFRMNS